MTRIRMDLYLLSGLAVGLALIGLSLAYGRYIGVVAGGGWSIICVGRLLFGRASTKIAANESVISWLSHQRRLRRGSPPPP
jgi:hypothetical protein